MGDVVAGTDLRLCAVAPIALWFQGLQGNRTSTLRISLRIHHNFKDTDGSGVSTTL